MADGGYGTVNRKAERSCIIPLLKGIEQDYFYYHEHVYRITNEPRDFKALVFYHQRGDY